MLLVFAVVCCCSIAVLLLFPFGRYVHGVACGAAITKRTRMMSCFHINTYVTSLFGPSASRFKLHKVHTIDGHIDGHIVMERVSTGAGENAQVHVVTRKVTLMLHLHSSMTLQEVLHIHS